MVQPCAGRPPGVRGCLIYRVGRRGWIRSRAGVPHRSAHQPGQSARPYIGQRCARRPPAERGCLIYRVGRRGWIRSRAGVPHRSRTDGGVVDVDQRDGRRTHMRPSEPTGRPARNAATIRRVPAGSTDATSGTCAAMAARFRRRSSTARITRIGRWW